MELAERSPPLNAIRVFTAIAREASVTRAAALLGITQSAASRHLAVLEHYLGGRVFHRRGRAIELSELGRLFHQATVDAMDTIDFTSRRMRQRSDKVDSLVVRTSLPTFAYSTLIPRIPDFSKAHGDVAVDIVTSLAAPKVLDVFDVLITRDLALPGAAEHWELFDEHVVCAGVPALVDGADIATLLQRSPVISVSSRPDILPRWTAALGLPLARVAKGPRYDHHFLAIPAAVTGQGLLVAPEVVIADLLKQGILVAVPGSRVESGMQYHAYSVDRGGSFDLARAFCQWIKRLCRTLTPAPRP